MKKGTKLLKSAAAAAVVAASLFSSVSAFAAYTLYEDVTVEDVVKGVTYEKKHRLTDEGWLDLYILNIDLSNSDIRVEPVQSGTEIGLRERVGTILSMGGALAGVNASYFGMTGKYSSSFGPAIKDGEVLSIDTDKNLEGNQFGTYYEDLDGISHFDYFSTNIQVYVDGNSYFEFAGINTITEMIYPVCLTRAAGENTAPIDARFADLVKIVVEEGKVTKISQKGETVDIPENGYVIVLSSEYADAFLQYFYVGQKAELRVSSTFDIDKIQTAISGGGIILKDGQKPENIGEMASGRHPRTLLGLSEDQKTMKLIVADGKRSNGNNKSIGLTVDEAVDLLKAEGMYYGLNLDGGGSSVMAVKTAEEDAVSTVSSPAEGSERLVMTAVGVFDDSPVGDITQLVIKPESDRVVVGESVAVEVFGYDENLHKIPISVDNISFKTDENTGMFSGNRYTPLSIGNNFITAEYNSVVATTEVNVVDIKEIKPNQSAIYLNKGESANISVKGVTTDGYEVDLSGNVSISSDFGDVNGSTFTAVQDGGGYITCSYNGLTCYIKVVVGTSESGITSFEDTKDLKYSAYPKDIEGIAGISKAVVSDGVSSLGLSYYFKEAEYTQAAYLDFAAPIKINGTPKALKLSIKCNGSGQWVRGKIKDANGTEFVIEFTQNVDWTDWKDMTANIPSEAVYPITLNTIYVAALSNTNTNQQVMYFDNLRGEYPIDAAVNMPEPVKGLDIYEGNTQGKEQGYTYINVSGSITSGNAEGGIYTSARNQVGAALGKDSDIALFAGKSDIDSAGSAEVIKWKGDYAVYDKNGAVLINVFAQNGGIKDTLASQWQHIKSDAVNSQNKNVIIFMDLAPSKFNDGDEAELFNSMLQDIAEAGKNVFVLYSNTGEYSLTVDNGIRYISLPNLWTSGGTVNDNYKIVRFKVNGNDLKFEVLDVL